MYTHNGYFHPFNASSSFPPIPQIMLQNEGISPNDERLRLLNEQMLLSEARNSESYQLEQTSSTHIKQLCLAVEKHGNLDDCLKLLNKLEATNRHCHGDPAAKLKCKVLCEQSQFDTLYQLIQTHPFGKEYHKDLQSMWNDAHYKEAEHVRGGKGLDPVSRYRVRRKHKFPMTIWDGEGTSYCFKKRDRKILKAAYDENPMPNQADKQTLAQKTELSVVQVSNWFKNQRQRARQHKKDHHGRHYAHSISDGYIESERENSGSSRGSNPLSDEEEKPHTQRNHQNSAINEQHSLLNQQQLMSNSFSSINIHTNPATLLPPQQSALLNANNLQQSAILSANNLQQLNSTAPTSSTNTASMSTNIYNNFNFAPHFENYWPTTTNSNSMVNTNPFAAAQMYYPFGVYSYANYQPYQPVYPQSAVTATQQYIKIMDSDSLSTELSNQPNLALNPTSNNTILSQQPILDPTLLNQQENYQQQFGNSQSQDTKYRQGKYEPSDQDYQNL